MSHSAVSSRTLVQSRERTHDQLPAVARDADADLVALARQGDVRSALNQLMQRHGSAVYRYCREALQDAVLADDVHQQVFIEAFRNLPRFEHRSSLRTWLFAIARHRILDAVKQRRRCRMQVEDDELTQVRDPRPSPMDSLDDARLRELLRLCLADLDESVRTAVLLRYQQGMSYEDMAVVCGEKPGTLHARVTRAMRLLRRNIELRLTAEERPKALSRSCSVLRDHDRKHHRAA